MKKVVHFDDDPKSISFVDDNIKSINNNIAFVTKNVHSLRSKSQSINLDAIIETMF